MIKNPLDCVIVCEIFTPPSSLPPHTAVPPIKAMAEDLDDPRTRVLEQLAHPHVPYNARGKAGKAGDDDADDLAVTQTGCG